MPPRHAAADGAPRMARRPLTIVPKFTSDFAILDVKKGRAALARRIRGGEQPVVTIKARLDHVWSRDDGTSVEFALQILDMAEHFPKVRAAPGLKREVG